MDTTGDLPVTETLQYLNEQILSQFSALDISQTVPLVDRLSDVKVVESTTAPYPGVPLETGNSM